MINLSKVFVLDLTFIGKVRDFDFGSDDNNDALPQMIDF